MNESIEATHDPFISSSIPSLQGNFTSELYGSKMLETVQHVQLLIESYLQSNCENIQFLQQCRLCHLCKCQIISFNSFISHMMLTFRSAKASITYHSLWAFHQRTNFDKCGLRKMGLKQVLFLTSYSLPSINVNPWEWIKVNVYRGVNS